MHMDLKLDIHIMLVKGNGLLTTTTGIITMNRTMYTINT